MAKDFFKDLPLFEEPTIALEAIESYKRLIVKEPKNPLYYYKLGRAYQAKKKKLEALDAYNEALRISRGFYPAHYGLGTLYTSIGKIQLAIREYTRALRIKPDFLEALYNLAICYQHSRAYSKAARILETYISLEKDPMWKQDADSRLEHIKTKIKTEKS